MRKEANAHSNLFRMSVKELIAKYNISQNELARCSGRSSGSLSQILNGNSTIRIETQQSIISALSSILDENGIKLEETDPLRNEIVNHNLFSSEIKRYKRHELDQIQDQLIENATNEIVFLGSLPQRRIEGDWYAIIANKLIHTEILNIYFFIESTHNLFWRALSLDQEIMFNRKSYQELKYKYELQSSDMKEYILKFIRDNTRDKTNFLSVASRLHIYEVDIPIYTIYVKVDDTIFETPRNHMRSSLSCTDVLDNVNDFKWKQANSYISFFKKNIDLKIFVSLPGEEKLGVYSDNAKLLRGYINRNTIKKMPELQTRVVHGLIFARNGKLLLHFRGDKAFDNRFLWDKSFGGNINVLKDISMKDTAIRELKEEIFDDLMNKLRDVNIRINKTSVFFKEPALIDCGDWRGMDSLIHLSRSNAWCFFHIEQCKQFPSVRRVDDLDWKIRRNHYADLFVFVCNNDFFEITNNAVSENISCDICKWINVTDNDIDKDKCTDDLWEFLSSKYYTGLLTEFEMAIKAVWNNTNNETGGL